MAAILFSWNMVTAFPSVLLLLSGWKRKTTLAAEIEKDIT